jgi:iron complex outermembrane receptor protein
MDANKWSIGIRGFGTRFSRGVLVLIDGRTVYSTLLAGTYWEVQDTRMDDIDRIEVIRGPGGTIWGPNAVNGVINVITKNAAQTHGLAVSAGGGNEEQVIANTRYGGSYGNNWDYRIYAKAADRSPEVHSDGRNYDDWRLAQGGFRADWNNHARDRVTIQGDLYKEEAGESVSAISYTQPYSRILYDNAHLSGGNVLARWTKNVSANNDIQVQAYFDRTNRNEPNFGEHRNTFDIDFLQHLRLPARQQISWGLGARFSHASNQEVVSGLTFLPNARTDQLYTAFLQDEIGVVDERLKLILGTKVLRTNFTGFDFEPSARLIWTPTPSHALWAAYTHALRTPSDAEENFFLSGYIGNTSSGVPYFARFNANRRFVPEQLNGYEIGYRQLLGKRLSVDLATFYNHYHDLVDQEITGSPFLENSPAPAHFLLPAQFGNGLLGSTKGFEIAPEWQPTRFWQVRGAYSFLRMALQKSPTSLDVGTALGIAGSSPKHEGTIQSSFALSRAVTLDLTWRYVAALPAMSVPAYSTADARFAWRLREHFEIALVGRNLLQPSHPEYGQDPGPIVAIRRSAYLKLTWNR